MKTKRWDSNDVFDGFIWWMDLFGGWCVWNPE